MKGAIAAIVIIAVLIGAGWWIHENVLAEDPNDLPPGLDGKSLVFDVEGEEKTNTYSVSVEGTQKLTYLAYVEDREDYLMERVSEFTKTVLSDGSSGGGSGSADPETTTDRFWNKDGSRTWANFNFRNIFDGKSPTSKVSLETESFGTVETNLYQTVYDQDGAKIVEKRWVGTGDDRWIIYRITVESTLSQLTAAPEIDYTYTLSRWTEDGTAEKPTVTVVTEDGIEVTGSGTYGFGEKVTLTASASGKGFGGWYDLSTMEQLGAGTSCSFTAIGDVTIAAVDSEDETVTEETHNFSVSGISPENWRMYGPDGGIEREINSTLASWNYTFIDGGTHILVVSGTGADGSPATFVLKINADISLLKTFAWKFDGTGYEYSLSIKRADYDHFRDLTAPSDRRDRGNSSDVNFAVTADTADDSYLKTLADYFADKTEGWSGQKTAGFVLAFVQYIEYKYDSDSVGYDEYWKYPLETLFDQNGDCEDTTILYCAIMREMGYDTAMIIMPGHMAAGVSVEWEMNYTGSKNSIADIHYVELGGVKYYYGETTGTGWHIGEVPSSTGLDKLDEKDITVYAVKGLEEAAP